MRLFFAILFASQASFIFSLQTTTAHLISNEGDTTVMKILLPIKSKVQAIKFWEMQGGIAYLNESNKQKRLKPSEYQEVFFQHNDQTIRLISILIGVKKHSFVNLVDEVDGIALYQYFKKDVYHQYDKENRKWVTGEYYFKKGEEKLFKPGYASFNKEMSVFFFQCESLAKRLREGEFGPDELEGIMVSYKSECSMAR